MAGKYFFVGARTGYDIARENISEYSPENHDKFVSDMAEHESEVYRQFSPFEFLAQEMNEWEEKFNKQGVLWDAYERGVIKGIERAIKEREE